MFEYFANWTNEEWRFAEPQWLPMLWAIPLLLVISVLLSLRSRRSTRRLGDPEQIESLLGRRRRWNIVTHLCLTAVAFSCLVIAVARPQSDPREVETETKGRDVVFLLDVSRSMLARDVAPNRLDKAKLWISDLVDELGGDRVGLVAFAGSSTVVSPLTNDRLFFKLALDELSPDSVLMGGTNIGDAIRRTMELVFPPVSEEEQAGNFRDIILISDGEDQESLPIEAARRAGAEGVRIISIGIGSDKGALIQTDQTDGGSTTVRSKLESQTLRDISIASPGGVYLEVGTGTIDLAEVYRDLIESAYQRSMGKAVTTKYTERFMLFLAVGISILLLDILLIPTNPRRVMA